METENPERLVDLDPPRISMSPKMFVVEESSSATSCSNSKTLSSSDSSEDEDEEKEVAATEVEAASILPPSVLDKADAIANLFTSSFRRGSLVQDDPCSPLPSRTGSSASLSTEPSETFGAADSSPRRRRDSTLSKQDQLLIRKIRSYYENAGNQDPSFVLQRRESLSYIPAGLVRSSVSRIDGDPKNGAALTNSEISSAETCPHPVSSEEPENLQEEFRPSSEMIKIWEVMEATSCDESDLSVVAKEFPHPSPGQQKETLKVFEEEAVVLRAPRIRRLQADSEHSNPVDDNVKSKVLNLARQYSQRIKTTMPVVRQRSRNLLIGTRSLSCVLEEKESSGMKTSTGFIFVCSRFMTF